MELKIIDNAAHVVTEGIVLADTDDALQLIADCGEAGCEKVVLRANNIAPAFFDLRTGVAGEVLQKFSTYNTRLMIVGDFSHVESKALRDFIRESNRQGRIIFIDPSESPK
jgi:hypothetical protein